MGSITVADTLELSIPERIQLVEEIWDTIAARAEAAELTGAEKKIIDERLEAHRRDPRAGATWEEVYTRITKKHEIRAAHQTGSRKRHVRNIAKREGCSG